MNRSSEERHLLRRIAICFAIVVVTMPLVLLGGHWNWILPADIAVAVVSFRASLALREIRRSQEP